MLFNTEDIQADNGLSFHQEISDLPDSMRHLEGTSPASVNTLRADFDISVGANDYLLLGQLEGKFGLNCSRCLNPYQMNFEADMESNIPKSVDNIDVGEEIRQSLLLAIPEKPICRQDCKGFCQVCGGNKNKQACSCQPPKPNPFSQLKNLYNK